MKSIVIYYSTTGNTKRIAEAIHSGIKKRSAECEIARLDEVDVQQLLNYDLIGLGSPVWGFQEPPFITGFIKNMPSMKGRYSFTFCTHGVLAGGYIARMVKALRKKGLIVIGWNDWYGSGYIQYAPKPYYTDSHPDEIDLKEARDFGREIVERSRRVSKGETSLIPRLPRKEKYDKLYGAPPPPNSGQEEVIKVREEIMPKLKPKINTDKCNYPKCTICMDNCPTHSINLSETPQISYETCGPCPLWFCESLCPTGAVEVDWQLMDKLEDYIKPAFNRLTESLETYKDIRRFRSLLTVEEGSDMPLYKRKKHPKLVIHDGVVTERR